jgi:hypothetical protein
MAKLVCQVDWNPDKNMVTKTWKVLSLGPNDSVQLVTTDSTPFIVKATNAKLAGKLGLVKTPNGYEVKTAPATKPRLKLGRIPAWLKWKCGTIANGKFKSWGGVGPKGLNDGDGY